MVERRNRLRLRRALILALFLLMPALLCDLSLFSKSGHRPAPGGGAPVEAASGDAAREALLPVEPDTLSVGPGSRHWRTAAGAEGDDFDHDDRDALLQNLVYLTHARGTEDSNLPLNDGFHFGDDSSGHGGGAGGGDGFGGGGFGARHDPGTDFLPLSFGKPGNDGGDDKGGGGSGGDRPSFLSPAIPSIAAVPEPATWALFILGFGFIGAQLRRARDARRAPALTRARGKRLG